MVINKISFALRGVISKEDYVQVEVHTKENEIPVGRMNDQEKAIYSLLFKLIENKIESHDQVNTAKFLIKKLKNSLKRFGKKRYSCRSGFIVVTELDISSLIWRPYSPNLN